MALTHFDKELRKIWKKIRGKNAPHPHMAGDIEELLRAQEWGVALEHILDWAAFERKTHLIETHVRDIREAMKLEHSPDR